MPGIQQWWNELPPVTKYLFALSMGISLAGNFGLVSPYYFILNWSAVFKGFEVL
jgi:derlin-1